MSTVKRIHTGKEKMNFGKYAGKQFLHVLNDNPGYIKWALDTGWLIIENRDINSYVQDILFDTVRG